MPEREGWKPDRLTRQHAATIRSDDVECLKFGGLHMGGFIGYDPIVVYDRRLIRLFIEALHQAMIPTPSNIGLMNRVNQMMVCFKRNKAGKPIRAPEFFNFKPDDPNSSFGPAFVQALQELSRYQADRVRQKARQLAPQVVAIEVVGDKIIRDGPTVRRLLSELQQLDEKAFAYTEQSESMGLWVHLQGRKRWQVTLMVSGAAAQAARNRSAPPPLPPTLWRLFEQATSLQSENVK